MVDGRLTVEQIKANVENKVWGQDHDIFLGANARVTTLPYNKPRILNELDLLEASTQHTVKTIKINDRDRYVAIFLDESQGIIFEINPPHSSDAAMNVTVKDVVKATLTINEISFLERPLTDYLQDNGGIPGRGDFKRASENKLGRRFVAAKVAYIFGTADREFIQKIYEFLPIVDSSDSISWAYNAISVLSQSLHGDREVAKNALRRAVEIYRLDAAMTSDELKKFQGTGYSWSLSYNASTQSFKALLVGEDSEGNVGPIWTNEEVYTQPEYATFGAPNGHVVSVHEKDKSRFVTDPLMSVAALENTMAKLQKFCQEHGLDMSNIRSVVPANQQHEVVYMTKQAAEPFELTAGKPVWEQFRDRNFLASKYSAIWRDESTTKQGEALVAHFGGQDQLLNQTGSPFQGRFAGGHMLQESQEQPAQWKRTYRILPGSGFLNFVLTGDLANSFMDPGESVSSHLVQVRKPLEYLPNLNRIIPGIEEKLPKIKPSNTAVGTISTFWTKYGLSPETIVVNGTGDNPPQLVGFGMTDEGTAMSLGTSFTLFANIKSLKALEKVLLKSKIGNVMGTAYGKWMKLICFQNGGLALQDIRDKYITDQEAIDLLNEKNAQAAERYTVAQLEGMDPASKEKLIGPSKWEIFERLLKETEPGNGGSMMITQNKNESVVDIKYEEGKYHSRDLVFSPENRAKVLRAAAEGQIYFLKYLADKIGLDIKTINLGGGVARNRSIRQIIADIFGVKVYVLEGNVEPVTMGAAITAWKVAYDKTHKKPISWKSAARNLAKLEEVPINPIPQNVVVYQGFLPKFGKMVEEARDEAMKGTPKTGWDQNETIDLKFLLKHPPLDDLPVLSAVIAGLRLDALADLWDKYESWEIRVKWINGRTQVVRSIDTETIATDMTRSIRQIGPNGKLEFSGNFKNPTPSHQPTPEIKPGSLKRHSKKTGDDMALNINQTPLAKSPSEVEGGIDLSQQDSAMHIVKDANGGVTVDVDPALIARVEREGMLEVDPVIISMRPADIQSLFGINVPISTP